jgi:hypothetical protein
VGSASQKEKENMGYLNENGMTEEEARRVEILAAHYGPGWEEKVAGFKALSVQREKESEVYRAMARRLLGF